MSCKMLIVDGIRYREDDAKARGLIGERKVPAGSRAVSSKTSEPEKPAVEVKEAEAEAPVRARNKSRKPASK